MIWYHNDCFLIQFLILLLGLGICTRHEDQTHLSENETQGSVMYGMVQ